MTHRPIRSLVSTDATPCVCSACLDREQGAEMPSDGPVSRRRTREEWLRLWAKSISWRTISTGTLFMVAWLYTGSVESGGVVALIHMLITIVLYVPHDLVWESGGRAAAAKLSSPLRRFLVRN